MDSKEVGLVMGLMVGQFFFDTDDLHYGFWPDDLEVKPEHIKQAQENHSRLILETIPADVRTILDVGCGAGGLARRLLDHGYTVDAVSPSGPLTAHAQKIVGPDCRIIPARFEEVTTEKRYDLVMFSESFQYVDIDRGLEQVVTFLKPGGYLLICDFFRRTGVGRSPIRGGHRVEEFSQALARYPFTGLLDRDITRETARNYDLLNDFLTRVGVPVWNLAFAYAHSNYPRLTRLAKRVYRKKIEKTESKYFRGQRTAANFAKHKIYRLLLYRLDAHTGPACKGMPCDEKVS